MCHLLWWPIGGEATLCATPVLAQTPLIVPQHRREKEKRKSEEPAEPPPPPGKGKGAPADRGKGKAKGTDSHGR